VRAAGKLIPLSVVPAHFLVLCLKLLRVLADARIGMREITLEGLPLLSANEPFPANQPLEVVEILSIRQFFLSESRTVLAEMTSVPVPGKALVRTDRSAAPAEVTALLLFPFTGRTSFLDRVGHLPTC
jgi:hypothetical protein